MADPEAILDALAAGLSVEKAAKRFHAPIAEVRKILRDEVERCRDGEHMREVWTLADRRLAAVELKFYNKALEGDGDPQSAIVFVKTSDRRATLAGANMPQNHVLQVVSTPPEAKSSTRQIREALDNVLGITSRERELEDKELYSDDMLTADEQAELDQLRAVREAKREAEREAQGKQDFGPAKPH
jgi:hypothetical protein